MQKKIIALAIAAAFSAPAFADTTVYGIVDAAVANFSSSVANSKGHLTVISGGLSTSRVGVKTVEDLDNGMKVVAVLEDKLDVSEGATTLVSPRQKILALAGGFGTVAAGYAQTTGYDWAVKFNPFAGSAVDALASVNSSFLIGSTAVAARAPHALAYISPDLGGVTVAYNHSFDVANSGSSVNKMTANLLSATYAAGPLAVGAVYAGAHQVNVASAGSDITDVALAASYDLGAAKLFGTYQTNKTNADNAKTNNAMSFSAVAPVGPGAIVASLAVATIKGATDDDKKDTLSLAYLQGLSKTTTAYAALTRVGDKANSAADKVTITVLAVGLKKAF
jgi:general bacterial porin, GBP family